MIPFLQSVAIELTARQGSDLGHSLIVVPHKRGVTFLRRYFENALRDRLQRQPDSREMPRIVTISDHVAEISGLKRAGRLQALFTLYGAYRHVFEKDAPPTANGLEEFRRWGETALSDFNDVDMYDVDADALFRNLADYNDIATDFLTPEQRAVIEKYFGVLHSQENAKRFWRHFDPNKPAQKRFLSLWQKLAPLYREFSRSLQKAGIGYPGLMLRRACERIEKGEYRFFAAKVAYVGFNALSTMERRLFKAVKHCDAPGGGSLADFFWDAPGPALAEKSPVDAARFLRKNINDFPCSVPEMDNYSDISGFPETMQEISCPGNTAQAKVAGQLLGQLDLKNIDPSQIAVVLPDEGLLFPMFHSMPGHDLKDVNITMGYPLRLTAVASFIDLVRRLQTRSREVRRSSEGGVCFETRLFGKDVRALLTHPLTRTILGQKQANRINGRILESHLYFVTLEDLERLSIGEDEAVRSALRVIFSPLPHTDDPAMAVKALQDVLELAKKNISGSKETETAESPVKTAHIDTYLNAFSEFTAQCKAHGIRMPASTAYSMACRLVASETVNMQGEPLSGLQIMGMLETRALDFDYLIIPSMNERVFPRKLRPRTFIPEALRIGYGMATTRFQEEIFAYHFYRLIARAKEVYLLYDASQGGVKSGDPSRYLLQLRYLFADKCPLKRISARFRLSPVAPASANSAGKKEVSDLLTAYKGENPRKRLSASSLKDYIACPQKFFLSYILDKRTDEEPEEFMDAKTIGNVLHQSMEYMYNSLAPGTSKPDPDSPVRVEPATIRAWMSGKASIGEYSDLKGVLEHFVRINHSPCADPSRPLSGDAVIMLEMLHRQVLWCLEADLRLAPFDYLASELKENCLYTLPNGDKVGMTMIIDRLDRITGPDGKPRLRIVDYKTGSDDVQFSKTEELFNGNSSNKNSKAIFQLMLYAILLSEKMPELAGGRDIAISIYKTRQLKNDDYNTLISHNGKPVYSHLPYVAEFRSRLDSLLDTLFDEEVPFAPPENLPDPVYGSCRYCPYKALCSV